MAREPRLSDQVRQRTPFFDAPRRELLDRRDLGIGHDLAVRVEGVLMPEIQMRKDEPRGLVHGIVRAVPELELGLIESLRDPSDQIFDAD